MQRCQAIGLCYINLHRHQKKKDMLFQYQVIRRFLASSMVSSSTPVLKLQRLLALSLSSFKIRLLAALVWATTE
jgi:hypothetical protein